MLNFCKNDAVDSDIPNLSDIFKEAMMKKVSIEVAQRISSSLSSERKFFLDKVNDFNLEVRYPEFRKEFYKTCTRKFAEPQFIKIKETFQWLKSQIK